MSEVVNRTGEKAKVASVLLLTDGLANVGISNSEGILAEMRKVIDPPGGGTVCYNTQIRIILHLKQLKIYRYRSWCLCCA